MSKLIGEIKLKGDKSISHRALIFAVLANGISKIKNLSTSVDVRNTINCLISCGANIQLDNNGDAIFYGSMLSKPRYILDCGNSGTTIRLLMGLMAGYNIPSDFTGDESLIKRPMNRVTDKLQDMGVVFSSTKFPIKLKSGVTDADREINVDIASAQVKTAIIFAALGVNGITKITGKIRSRDHTERMLISLSDTIKIDQECISVNGKDVNIKPFNFQIPGDTSSAAFIIGSAIIRKGSFVKIKNLLANRYRLGFVDVLKRMGANISIYYNENNSEIDEPTCDIEVGYSELVGTSIHSSEIPFLIDEIPLISVLAAQARGETTIEGAEELRVKESDRISNVCMNLKSIGVDVEEKESGMCIKGTRNLYNTNIYTKGDHRIALAFMVLSSIIDGGLDMDDIDCAKYSFPEFLSIIKDLEK